MTEREERRRIRSLMATTLGAGVIFLLSGCHGRKPSDPLEGLWIGTAEVGDDLLLMRAEFERTPTGLSGMLHVQATGELTLVSFSDSSGKVLLEMKRADEDFVVVAGLRQGALVGHLHRGPMRMPFRLHRIVSVDPELLAAYTGTYQIGSDSVRSIEDCTDELGWEQLIYFDHESGGRKALFPISENTFFFGPGYFIPDPVEGTVTFLNEKGGRPKNLLWDQAGSTARIATRINLDEEKRAHAAMRRYSGARCKPLSWYARMPKSRDLHD